MRFIGLLAMLACATQTVVAQRFDVVSPAGSVSIVYAADGKKLDSIAAHLLAGDVEAVTGVRPVVTNKAAAVSGNAIIIGAVQSSLIQSLKEPYFRNLQGKWECYAYKLVQQPLKNISRALVIAGSDARGTAYGVFSLSEKFGVSPWRWWADVHPEKKKSLSLQVTPFSSLPPSVKFRGIFINDEDWGLQPWAAKTFEPETGDIGPKTYAKVFELLLRLKANLIWPAMHESTKAFFHYPGNPKVAEDYQIVIGSSHAEPMLRNNVGEWDVKTMGRFNYLTNKEKILRYWEDRVKQSKGVNAVYSLGIRGVHDSQMEGVKDLKEAVPVVEQVIKDERDLLSKHINKDVTAVPQVLTPYKEVLEIYDNGLKVPEDVTLVWPDDNYGYIHRLNNEKEKARKGGAGVYYHASYWGRPHDYLWLPSAHPGLMREEMMKAYETGADRLWVVNVGDIKPIEYNMQFFLDMAFNPKPFTNSQYSKRHLLHWATGIFGKEKANAIANVLWDYYGLAFERKPEFMGWSRTEPTTQTTYTGYNHFYYGDEAQKRIDQYGALEKEVKKLRSQIPSVKADAFYQLVYYPVVGASLLNKKFLYRDKADLYGRQGRLSAYDYAGLSKASYDSIVAETDYFNHQLAGGKWKGIMSMAPRKLPVFGEPVLPQPAMESAAAWNISPEGHDTSQVDSGGPLLLPSFDDVHRQRYFVDVFLSKPESLAWKATASQSWIRLSKTTGLLDAEQGSKQMRIWVEVDWGKAAGSKLTGAITFEGGGQQRVLNVRANKLANRDLTAYKGFVEANGFVSLRAVNFTRRMDKAQRQWKVINGLGYAGDALQALPLSIENKVQAEMESIEKTASFVTYDFYTFTEATPVVTVFALPTHPLNNDFRVRYAVSVDDGPLKVVDIKTVGRSEEWKQNVLRNRAERKIELPFLKAGGHTLKIYVVDPGVILDEITIDLGGLKKAYGSIPETKKAADGNLQ